MPLLTEADLRAPSPYFPEQTVRARVQARIHDKKRPMPPAGVLDAATLAPLEAWLAADSHSEERAENCTESALPPQSVPWPVECDDVYVLRSHDPSDPLKPFAVPANVELQKGVALSLPWANSSVQALAIRPLLDNTRIVHHWVLASGEPDAPFGKWLWGWAPGVGPSALLPDDVGMEIPAGPLNLNMHYYNIGGPATSDTSGLEVCVTRRFRKYTAAVGMDFNSFPVAIPPRQRSESEGECRVITTTDEPLHLLALAPHMHKLGAHMRVAVVHDGVERVIHDADYNFTDQGYYPQKDVIIQNGDVVRTRCTYQNDTDKVVSSGESSDEEMCVAFALHWPAHAYLCAPL
jgi:Copper type II ascorbate-dependent monooxygenase, C-terminal domain